MSTVERALRIEYVPIERVHPNEYNPNRQSERVYEAERQSIRRYGFLVPVLVRTHPELENEWLIVDGEHRWRGAGDEGYLELPIIPIDGLTEADAKKLTIVLNETKGESDLVPLARLLVELRESEGSIERLMEALPYERRHLEDLLRVGGATWDDFDPNANRSVEDHLKRSSGENLLVLRFEDQAQFERAQGFIEMLAHEWQLTNPAAVVLMALETEARKL